MFMQKNRGFAVDANLSLHRAQYSPAIHLPTPFYSRLRETDVPAKIKPDTEINRQNFHACNLISNREIFGRTRGILLASRGARIELARCKKLPPALSLGLKAARGHCSSREKGEDPLLRPGFTQVLLVVVVARSTGRLMWPPEGDEANVRPIIYTLMVSITCWIGVMKCSVVFVLFA